MKVSIIIPCYNALGKIEACINSLQSIDFDAEDFEVIFVDDCSSDGTYEYLQSIAQFEQNWFVYRLISNSGSPSKPRNYGTEKASGKYIVYLDCDDRIYSDTIKAYYEYALSRNACIVRGYLVADDGTRDLRILNRITGWDEKLSKKDRIKEIISNQSTTVVSFIKKDIITDNEIFWDEDIRVGEDTIFIIDVLVAAKNIQYFDHPTFIYNIKLSRQSSSTQQYGRRELKNHLLVWFEAEKRLNRIGLSYNEIRLDIALAAAMRGMIFHNTGDIDQDIFQEFCDFLKPLWSKLRKRRFEPHHLEILDALFSEDYAAFEQACKPRLLIAGYELKFILPSLDVLRGHFNILIDEWEGHEMHNEKKSRKFLQWAEYIWCEWLLGNAVWYSANKLEHQKLIIRMHRMELERDYGESLNVDAIHAVVTVSVLFFERLLQKFSNLPRHKVRLIPNYSMLGEKESHRTSERLFKLGAVGIVPSRKGFLRMLRILVGLRMKDPRYSLDVFGHRPEHFSWITRDRVEAGYYLECNKFIENNGLSDHVNFVGFAKMPEALSERKIGFVLSTSVSGGFPGFESFHLAVLDGFAGGGQGVVLRWDGCEYIYPSLMIFDTEEEIIEHISNMTIEKFYEESEFGRALISSRYSRDHFVRSVVSIFKE